ncbi:hypothetical protein J3R83DRAFT_12459 [Lanmaoa asiatica]|nr:hypothetical protein J3R83DRAFT_12459 [Lanmaoa asiatica]
MEGLSLQGSIWYTPTVQDVAYSTGNPVLVIHKIFSTLSAYDLAPIVISYPGKGPYRFDASYENPWILSALELWDEDKLDREWVVRNVLGGIAAGFGLRVVLDCHPVSTTMVILVGWAVKTAVAELLKDWVGDDPQIGEVWLAYSIP